jgi:hypothetical protein
VIEPLRLAQIQAAPCTSLAPGTTDCHRTGKHEARAVAVGMPAIAAATSNRLQQQAMGLVSGCHVLKSTRLRCRDADLPACASTACYTANPRTEKDSIGLAKAPIATSPADRLQQHARGGITTGGEAAASLEIGVDRSPIAASSAVAARGDKQAYGVGPMAAAAADRLAQKANRAVSRGAD